MRIDNAFSQSVADEARNILWKDTGCDPSDPSTWTKPVIRLGNYAQEPFKQAANTKILHAAADQLVGRERWTPLGSLGTFPIRFPSAAPTRILVGSHLDFPSLLRPAGETGLTFIELAQRLTTTLERKVKYATGKAGTVYLCHPFPYPWRSA